MRPALGFPPQRKEVSSPRIKLDLSLSGFSEVLEPARKGRGPLLRIWPKESYRFKLNGSFYPNVPQVLKKAYQSYVKSGDKFLEAPTPINVVIGVQPTSHIQRSKAAR